MHFALLVVSNDFIVGLTGTTNGNHTWLKYNSSFQFNVDFSLGISVRKKSSGPYRGQMEGLLGNYDGDPDNDFILYNGSILPTTASEEELYNFGQSCK